MAEETHIVRRAIIMAAGMGNRMHPLTFTTPKPLITVNGVRMIDSIIDGLIANGIEDINIVTGYLADKFEVLLSKYPGIKLINNPYYDKYNNISSLYVAKELLDTDVIITDADQIIYNNGILAPVFEKSGYNATEVTAPTDEWVMTVKDGIVTSCSRTGGNEGWQLYSVSRWSREDALKLKGFLELEFEKNERRDVYWDDIPMFLHADDFRLGIRIMNKEDILEIDSLEELQEIDSSYLNIKGE
ncbi:MAG: phosphocholine cytidylyltransferase family protein [Saccharofermentans sp.]|nr:phosphocholine cytidylyltransferase family protein [Saccharofermentans sp.]